MTSPAHDERTWTISAYCANEYYDVWKLQASGPMLEPRRSIPPPSIEVMPVAEHERALAATRRVDALRRSASEAYEVLGAVHVMEDGPKAGWRGEGDGAWYDDDARCLEDCAVCLARAALLAALTVPEPEEKR